MHQLHAYAIVSENDCIADAGGGFPKILRNEADWAYFQAALDRAAITLLGRRSHEASPNTKGRLRLVMSRSVNGLERQTDAWWWNPTGMPLAEAFAVAAPRGGDVAVPGGQEVFDELGAGAFATFHLARAHGRVIPQGRGLFQRCESGTPAEDILRAGGLQPSEQRWLDQEARVSLTIWRRQPARR